MVINNCNSYTNTTTVSTAGDWYPNTGNWYYGEPTTTGTYEWKNNNKYYEFAPLPTIQPEKKTRVQECEYCHCIEEHEMLLPKCPHCGAPFGQHK